MLPASARLRRSADFAAAVRRGPGTARVARSALVVHLRRGPDADGPVAPHAAPARAGFVVSRAVGPAVVRNRVRRRLRHLVRDRLPLLPAGTRLVVRALPPAVAASFDDLARQLDSALRRAVDSAFPAAEGHRARGTAEGPT